MNHVITRSAKPVGKFRSKLSVRREKFFEQQNRERQDFFEELRLNAFEALFDNGKTAKKPSALKSRKHKQNNEQQGAVYISHQLVLPDFFVDVPANLAVEWFAYLRPEGTRVFLITEGGYCRLFSKAGHLLDTFKCSFASSGITILDGILVAPLNNEPGDISDDQKDGGLDDDSATAKKKKKKSAHSKDFRNSTTECRRFLLQSRFFELEPELSVISRGNERIIRLVSLVDATPDNLTELYTDQSSDFISDGIMFVHKEAFYTAGVSQLFLCWRDERISRYSVDTPDRTGRTVPDKQTVTLRLRLKDGAVLTEDHVIVSRIPVETIEPTLSALESTIYLRQWGEGKLTSELLIRATIDGLNLALIPNTVIPENSKKENMTFFSGITVIGTPSPKRSAAESLNRIIHQYIMRQRRLALNGNADSLSAAAELLSFEDIVNASVTGEPNSKMLFMDGDVNVEEMLDDSDEDDDSCVEECEDIPQYC